MLPVYESMFAGSWLIASVFIVRMIAMSSTILAVCGRISDTQAPDLPCCWKEYADGATGKRFWPAVMPVTRWPLRTDAGRSWSKRFTSSGL